jgi:hypothetical protein
MVYVLPQLRRSTLAFMVTDPVEKDLVTDVSEQTMKGRLCAHGFMAASVPLGMNRVGHNICCACMQIQIRSH